MSFDRRMVIASIADLRVSPDPEKTDGIAAIFEAQFDDGEKHHLGLSTEALQQLCMALLENSPRAPGTPGRN